jgi:hypothetical protein
MVPDESERTPYDQSVVAAWYERNHYFLVLTLILKVQLNTKLHRNQQLVSLKLQDKILNLGTK